MKDIFEKQFGSDEALGIVLEDDDGNRYTDEDMAKLKTVYGDNFEIEVFSVFPNGRSAIPCTNYAEHIESIYPGRARVVGFANKDNPESLVAIEEFHPEGHDFAIVDGRWLIDPWVRLVSGVEEQICYDLHDKGDAEKALKIYGPSNRWSLQEDFDKIIKPEFSLEQLARESREYQDAHPEPPPSSSAPHI